MISFLDSSHNLDAALDFRFDPGLVLLSFFVALISSYSVLYSVRRIRAIHDPAIKLRFFILGPALMGLGIWTMHFIGMLAYRVDLPIAFNTPLTLLSVLPAIVSSYFALRLFSWDEAGFLQTSFSGFLLGSGIALMHFIGMEAMIIDAVMVYDPVMFLLSLVIGLALSVLALHFNQYLSRRTDIAVTLGVLYSSAVLASAVTALHYIAMMGMYLLPASTSLVQAGAMENSILVFIIVIASITVSLAAVVITLVDRRYRRIRDVLEDINNLMFSAMENIDQGIVLFDSAGELAFFNKQLIVLWPEASTKMHQGFSYETLMNNIDKMEDPDIEKSELLTTLHRNLVIGEKTNIRKEVNINDKWIQIIEKKTDSGGYVQVWTDISESKNIELSLTRKAFFDSLTGLPNRELFQDRLLQALASARRNRQSLAVMYLDLDGFKQINDTHGHDAGDEILKGVASRLLANIRESDTAARLGGDEFAIILNNGADVKISQCIAERIIDSMTGKTVFRGNQLIVGTSIGIAMFPDDADSDDELLKKADMAMYEAKAISGNCYIFAGNVKDSD